MSSKGKKILLMIIASFLYSLLLVFAVRFFTDVITDYIIKNDEAVKSLMIGVMSFIIPLIISLMVTLVLRKILNLTFKGVFAKLWTFILTIGFIIILSYLFLDGFDTGLLSMLVMIISVVLTYISLGKEQHT